MSNVPKTPGYYRACVYASEKRVRGVHQIVCVSQRPILTDGHCTGLEDVILQVGSAEPVPPDMVAAWGENVDPLGRSQRRIDAASKKLADAAAAVVAELASAIAGDTGYQAKAIQNTTSGMGSQAADSEAQRNRTRADRVIALYEEAFTEARHLGIVP